jgi:hypothetical protein
MKQILTEDEILGWKRDGFLVKEKFADAATLEQLRTAFDETLVGDAIGDRMLGGITRQVMVPSQSHPVFDDNPLVELGKQVVRELHSTSDAVRVFDMLIFKPPGHPHETPWHQDMSYAGMPFAPAGVQPLTGLVQFWVPLDDVDEENGCMQFMAGHHEQPLMPHFVAGGEPDDPARLLAIEDPERHLDLERRVVAALPAGGVTMHGYGTPHYTGPNRSTDRQRRAYIFNIATIEAHDGLLGKSR